MPLCMFAVTLNCISPQGICEVSISKPTNPQRKHFCSVHKLVMLFNFSCLDFFLFRTFTFLSDQNRLLYNAYNMLELQIPQKEEQNAIQIHR